MHRLRRLAPALVALFLFQLIVLGAGFGCAVPAFISGISGAALGNGPPGVDVHAASGDHAHHGLDAPGSGGLAAERGAPAPTHEPHGGQSHCSTAMACATAVIASAPALVPDAGVLAAGAATSLDPTAPALVFGAPETPPPRV